VPKLATPTTTGPSLATPGCTERASSTPPPGLLRGVRGAALLLWMIGCGSALVPVLNVGNAPVVVPRGEVASRDSVRNAILRALTGRGWRVVREGPDGIVASVSSMGQSATAQIQYDERSYSIHYVGSSPGLRFDGVAIHHRYNDWIDRLDRSIRTQLISPPSNDVRVIVTTGAADGGAQPLAQPPTTQSEAADAKPSAAEPSATTPDEPVMPPAPPPPPPTATPRQ
jgi:hypothetical protein